MNSHRNKPRAGESAQAKAETGHIGMNDVYGRRIEADRSWTVYHAFTGVPARLDGRALIGLGRAAATDRMRAMNLDNVIRPARRIHLDAPRLDDGEIGALR
jgi:hypothetical protein